MFYLYENEAIVIQMGKLCQLCALRALRYQILYTATYDHHITYVHCRTCCNAPQEAACCRGCAPPAPPIAAAYQLPSQTEHIGCQLIKGVVDYDDSRRLGMCSVMPESPA